jgi:hypothetical protein
MSETVIRMILGWTMRELGCHHSAHVIREIIVPDSVLLPTLMRGEVRVKEIGEDL